MILSFFFDPKQNPSVKVFAFATVVSRNEEGEVVFGVLASESPFSLSDASSSTFVAALRIVVKGALVDLRFRSRGMDSRERAEKPWTEQPSLGRNRPEIIETETYSCRHADMCAANRVGPKRLKADRNLEFLAPCCITAFQFKF